MGRFRADRSAAVFWLIPHWAAVQPRTAAFPPLIRLLIVPLLCLVYNGGMKQHHIARLEHHLETLVEGAFASLFGRRIRAQDLALQLARAMEDHLEPASGDDPALIAPDQYVIRMNPEVQTDLLEHHQELSETLSDHLLDLATALGYRMAAAPMVNLVADPSLDGGRLSVTAAHAGQSTQSTALLQPIALTFAPDQPKEAHLVINGTQDVPLDREIINIGRQRGNHIVLADPHVSRHHIQIRRRRDGFMLFDVGSQGGTQVNQVRVREHHLRSGDLIQIGRSQLLYLVDDLGDTQADRTQGFDPVES